jgi:hypothetical protein
MEMGTASPVRVFNDQIKPCLPDDLHLPDDGPSDDGLSEGDGAARVPLSEAITAVLNVSDDCAGDLSAIRHRLRQKELPEELDIDESALPGPAEQARHIAARLETCAGALRHACGEVGDEPGLSSED